MNVLKMGTLIALPLLSIDFTKAAEDRNKGGFDPYNSRPLYTHPSSTSSYPNYSYGSSSTIGAQTPLTEKEREFEKLKEDFYNKFHESFYISSFDSNRSIDEKIEMIKQETEFKTWENTYREKFYISFHCSDYQASKAQKIEMIKEEINLKDVEDTYSKRFHTNFEFSQRAIETSYRTIKSTSEKLKIITEEIRYDDLLLVYIEESLERPNISAATATAQPDMLKAAQIEALEEDIITQLVRSLKSAYPDITDEELERQYSQLPTAETGAPARSAIIEALRAEKQRRERR